MPAVHVACSMCNSSSDAAGGAWCRSSAFQSSWGERHGHSLDPKKPDMKPAMLHPASIHSYLYTYKFNKCQCQIDSIDLNRHLNIYLKKKKTSNQTPSSPGCRTSLAFATSTAGKWLNSTRLDRSTPALLAPVFSAPLHSEFHQFHDFGVGKQRIALQKTTHIFIQFQSREARPYWQYLLKSATESSRTGWLLKSSFDLDISQRLVSIPRDVGHYQ